MSTEASHADIRKNNDEIFLNDDFINKEIQNILDKHKLSDLKRFVEHSECLTFYNSYLAYLYIVFNTIGSFMSMYSTGTDNSELLWIGLGISAVSQLLSMFEKVNNEELKQIQKSIKAIREGTYIDERPAAIVGADGAPDKEKKKKKQVAEAELEGDQDNEMSELDALLANQGSASNKRKYKDAVSREIDMILNKEKLRDLARFIKMNERLNFYNLYLSYLFHVFNIGGSFVITYATTLNNKSMKWVGIGFNSFSQLIYLLEKLNNATLKQNLKDMVAIKNGTYSGEGATPEVEVPDESQDGAKSKTD